MSKKMLVAPERVEKPQASSGSFPSSDSKDESESHWKVGLRERLAQIEEEREEAQRKRRAGRPKGELTQSLVEKLRNCNVLQLQNVKKACDREMKRQSKPPSDYDCGERFTLRCLGSITVKTTRFRLEFRRTSLRSTKVYVNGPYIRRYWWDGSIVKSEHVKKGNKLRLNLPKKVWLAFQGLLDHPENEEIRKRLIEMLQRETE